jgi:hypothetical protein
MPGHGAGPELATVSVTPTPTSGLLATVLSVDRESDRKEVVQAPKPQGEMDLGLAPALRGLRFSIGGQARPADAVRTRRRFEINGGAAKAIAMNVADDGSIDVDARDLLRELEGSATARVVEKVSQAAGSADSISFDRLRSVGLDVRYDAVRDRIIITTPDS